MQKIDIIAQRIKSQYVGENCIQISIPYVKGLTIFDKDGIVYHQLDKSDNYTNKYLDDERKNNFPYSNIPIYYRKKPGYNVTYINQLYDFNKPYIIVGNGGIREHYAIKENDEALLVNRLINLNDGIETLKTRLEVEELFDKKNNEEIYIMGFDGAIADRNIPVSSEEKIHNIIKDKISEYIDYLHSHFVTIPAYYRFTKSSIENFNFGNDEIMDVELFNGVIVKITDFTGIELKRLNVKYLKDDCYKVMENDIPIREYNLEMVKCLAKKIYETKEPKISLFQNPNISKQDLKEANQKVKELKK